MEKMLLAEIRIEGATTSDLILALDEVRKHIDHECLAGSDSNESGRYDFSVKRMTVGDS